MTNYTSPLSAVRYNCTMKNGVFVLPDTNKFLYIIRYINSLEDFRKILAHKNPYCYLLLVTDGVCRASAVPPLCLRCASVVNPFQVRFSFASSPFQIPSQKRELDGGIAEEKRTHVIFDDVANRDTV